MKPGDKGLTSALTFVASANGIRYTGADAALVDIDPKTLGFSGTGLTSALATHSDASVIMPVHFGGLAGDVALIRKAAGERCIIEDACHALGGTYEDGSPVGCGKFADMSVFSFHPVKPITTAEGGAVVTNDPELADRLRRLRSHGIERDRSRFVAAPTGDDADAPWWYEQHELGFNYRLSDLHAALGASQMKRLDAFIARRREIASYYDQAFANLNAIIPAQADPAQRCRSAHHIYVIQADWRAIGHTRKSFMAALAERSIGSQVHYIPVYEQPVHHDLRGRGEQDFPETAQYYKSCLTLPFHQGLTDEEVERVVVAVKECAGQ